MVKSVVIQWALVLSQSEPKDNFIDELFKRADLKLYGAKDKGLIVLKK